MESILSKSNRIRWGQGQKENVEKNSIPKEANESNTRTPNVVLPEDKTTSVAFDMKTTAAVVADDKTTPSPYDEDETTVVDVSELPDGKDKGRINNVALPDGETTTITNNGEATTVLATTKIPDGKDNWRIDHMALPDGETTTFSYDGESTTVLAIPKLPGEKGDGEVDNLPLQDEPVDVKGSKVKDKALVPNGEAAEVIPIDNGVPKGSNNKMDKSMKESNGEGSDNGPVAGGSNIQSMTDDDKDNKHQKTPSVAKGKDVAVELPKKLAEDIKFLTKKKTNEVESVGDDEEDESPEMNDLAFSANAKI